MLTHAQIVSTLSSQLRERLEVKGMTETEITERVALLQAAANDHHLPNLPEDVLLGFVDTFDY